MVETEEAIRRFLEGEEEAFSRIVRQWERKVYNLAWRMLGNREDAQDVVQETFLSIFKNIRSLRDPSSFSTWLFKITLNHCRARRKSRSSSLLLSEIVPEQGEDNGGLLNVIPSSENAGKSVETLDIVRKALADLSEEHRTAIILKEYLGLSLEELAGVMNCPLSTAKSRLYHGLRGVQRNLKRMGIKFKELQDK
jgi:RNA polymerase sigma-70 factor, ECF subfamily